MVKRIFGRLKHHFKVVRSFSSKHVIQRFADEFGLVYFGRVDQHTEDHALIKGITASSEFVDRHYSVGSIQGYDVILVQRTDTVKFPKKQPKHYTWIIMQFDLHVPYEIFGHMLLDARHHDETFYANLFVKYAHFRKIDPRYFMNHDPIFVNYFNVYCPPESLDTIPYVLTPDITATLAHHFRHLDFEISGDRLLVYASNRVITRHELEQMTRAGLWLAERLDDLAGHFLQKQT